MWRARFVLTNTHARTDIGYDEETGNFRRLYEEELEDNENKVIPYTAQQLAMFLATPGNIDPQAQQLIDLRFPLSIAEIPDITNQEYHEARVEFVLRLIGRERELYIKQEDQ